MCVCVCKSMRELEEEEAEGQAEESGCFARQQGGGGAELQSSAAM